MVDLSMGGNGNTHIKCLLLQLMVGGWRLVLCFACRCMYSCSRQMCEPPLTVRGVLRSRNEPGSCQGSIRLSFPTPPWGLFCFGEKHEQNFDSDATGHHPPRGAGMELSPIFFLEIGEEIGLYIFSLLLLLRQFPPKSL